MNQSHDNMQKCTKLCGDCHTECQEMLFNYCLPTGGKHVEAEHVKLMTDCIQACQAAADFMSRNSKFYASECSACADVCEACADSCDRLGDEKMKRSAEICRKCAQSCREMGK